MKKIILILIILIIVMILSIFLIRFINNKPNKNHNYSRGLRKLLNKKIKYDKLLTVRYSDSGDMNGNVYEIELDIENKKLIKSESEGYPVDITVKEYKVSDKDIDSIAKLIRKYNLPAWTNLPFDYDNIVLDAAVENLYMAYDNREVGGSFYDSYSISYNTKIPTDGFACLAEVREMLKSFEKTKNLIKTYTKEY